MKKNITSFQKYMLPYLPKESLLYAIPPVKKEWYNSLTVIYKVDKQSELQISFDTEMNGLHYFFRQHSNYTKVIYSYHD